MSKIICVKCEVELRPECNDTLVVETASFGPYKLWCADTWRCPKCGIEIVSGFGEKPIKEHFENDFKEYVEVAKKVFKKVVHNNEFKGE